MLTVWFGLDSQWFWALSRSGLVVGDDSEAVGLLWFQVGHSQLQRLGLGDVHRPLSGKGWKQRSQTCYMKHLALLCLQGRFPVQQRRAVRDWTGLSTQTVALTPLPSLSSSRYASVWFVPLWFCVVHTASLMHPTHTSPFNIPHSFCLKLNVFLNK